MAKAKKRVREDIPHFKFKTVLPVTMSVVGKEEKKRKREVSPVSESEDEGPVIGECIICQDREQGGTLEETPEGIVVHKSCRWVYDQSDKFEYKVERVRSGKPKYVCSECREGEGYLFEDKLGKRVHPVCALFSGLGEKSGLCKICNKRSGQKLKFIGSDKEPSLGHPHCIGSAKMEGFEMAPAFIHALTLVTEGNIPKTQDIITMMRLKAVVVGNSATLMTELGLQNYTNSYHYLAKFFPSEHIKQDVFSPGKLLVAVNRWNILVQATDQHKPEEAQLLVLLSRLVD